jgi:hypothetical protein
MYSPELTLGSGFLAQSERVFLLFSSKLVLFSSNFFDLDTNLFGIWPFLNFLRKASQSAGIFLRNIGSFRFLARRLLTSKISAPQFASFSTKNAHYRNYRSYLFGFCGFTRNFISLCSFTKGCIEDFNRTGLMRPIVRESIVLINCELKY